MPHETKIPIQHARLKKPHTNRLRVTLAVRRNQGNQRKPTHLKPCLLPHKALHQMVQEAKFFEIESETDLKSLLQRLLTWQCINPKIPNTNPSRTSATVCSKANTENHLHTSIVQSLLGHSNAHYEDRMPYESFAPEKLLLELGRQPVESINM
jgi:hypothetical protein